MVGAAARGGVDGGGALVQRGVLALGREAAVAVLLAWALPTGLQAEGGLGKAVRVWTLA